MLPNEAFGQIYARDIKDKDGKSVYRTAAELMDKGSISFIETLGYSEGNSFEMLIVSVESGQFREYSRRVKELKRLLDGSSVDANQKTIVVPISENDIHVISAQEIPCPEKKELFLKSLLPPWIKRRLR